MIDRQTTIYYYLISHKMVENDISVEKNIIFYKNKILVQTDYDIEICLLTDEKLIVVIDGERTTINNNIYCYDLKGDLRWQIEEPDHLHSRNYFTSVYLSDTRELQAYNISGVEYMIDKNNGKFLRKELIK